MSVLKLSLSDTENSQINLLVPVRPSNALRASRSSWQVFLQASLTKPFHSSLAYCVRCPDYIWEIFKVIVYCSIIKVLCVVVSRDNFYILPCPLSLVNTFFILFFHFFQFIYSTFSEKSTACPRWIYIITFIFFNVNTFFHILLNTFTTHYFSIVASFIIGLYSYRNFRNSFP